MGSEHQLPKAREMGTLKPISRSSFGLRHQFVSPQGEFANFSDGVAIDVNIQKQVSSVGAGGRGGGRVAGLAAMEAAPAADEASAVAEISDARWLLTGRHPARRRSPHSGAIWPSLLGENQCPATKRTFCSIGPALSWLSIAGCRLGMASNPRDNVPAPRGSRRGYRADALGLRLECAAAVRVSTRSRTTSWRVPEFDRHQIELATIALNVKLHFGKAANRRAWQRSESTGAALYSQFRARLEGESGQ